MFLGIGCAVFIMALDAVFRSRSGRESRVSRRTSATWNEAEGMRRRVLFPSRCVVWLVSEERRKARQSTRRPSTSLCDRFLAAQDLSKPDPSIARILSTRPGIHPARSKEMFGPESSPAFVQGLHRARLFLRQAPVMNIGSSHEQSGHRSLLMD
jgi:hypothetical protein